MRVRIVVFGKDELSPRQKELIQKFLEKELGDYYEIEYDYKLGTIEREYLKKLQPREECFEEYEENAECVDYVVFEYDISWAITDLLKKGIKVLGFLTVRSINGDGDLFDGKVKTAGLAIYEPYYRKKALAVD